MDMRMPAAVALFALLWAPFQARAADLAIPAKAAEETCEFGEAIGALKVAATAPRATTTLAVDTPAEGEVAGTSTPSKDAPEKDELAMRRELLFKVIDCALNETGALEAGIKKVPQKELDAEHLSIVLLSETREVARKYGDLRRQAAGADKDELRNIAKEIAALRKDRYLPLWERSRAFVVWSTNRELADRASKRLEEVRRTLQALKVAEGSSAWSFFERASVQLLRAKEANYRASQAIERAEVENVLISFKETLDNLHGMYQNLLNLAGAVKAIK